VDISARAGRKQAAAKSSISGRECERDSDERQHGQVKHRFSHRLAAIDRLADHRFSGYPNARANPTCNIAKSQGPAAAQCEQRGNRYEVEKRLWPFREALSVLYNAQIS
jgi:hypothetical protein